MTYKRLKVPPECYMAALISGHPVLKSIAIHFHPCNPVFLPQKTCFMLFCAIFLPNLFMYLVAFGNIMWKLEIEISMISRDSVPLKITNYKANHQRMVLFIYCCSVESSGLVSHNSYKQTAVKL